MLNLAEQNHGGDDVRLVAGFLIHGHAIAIEDAGLNFSFLAADTRDIGRQAVHVQGAAGVGCFHQVLGALPILVTRILGKEFLFQGIDTVEVTLAVEVGTFLHGGERCPAFRVYNVPL